MPTIPTIDFETICSEIEAAIESDPIFAVTLILSVMDRAWATWMRVKLADYLRAAGRAHIKKRRCPLTAEQDDALVTAIASMRMLCIGCADKTINCDDCDIRKSITILRETKRRPNKEADPCCAEKSASPAAI